MVLQKNGTLREMRGDIFRRRRTLTESEQLAKEWAARVRAVKRSKKPSVQSMTFSQLEVAFARDNQWKYPPRTLPMMPTREHDWYRRVKDVELLTR